MISLRFVDSDWVLLSTGKVELISGPNRFRQNISKILKSDKENTINIGEIPFRYNPLFGTNIVFINALNDILTIEDALEATKAEVREAIIKYLEIQLEKQLLQLDDSEILADATVRALANRDTTTIPNRIVIIYTATMEMKDGETITIEGSTVT